MIKVVAMLMLAGAGMHAQTAVPLRAAVTVPNPVVQWNRNLLALVRTPGAQSPTIHSTRSFAIMHAAIYDAVNAIDQTHHAYRIQITGAAWDASKEAAAASAAHDVLVGLYPSFSNALDEQLQNSLALIADGSHKEQGIAIGQSVASQILALREDDGSAVQPPPFGFGNDPGDYQSTPPNFPKPQFTHWSHVTPFALLQANQFRSAPPPALTSPAYTDAFKEIKMAGVVHGTAASSEQALTGRFWNGSIQNYWNEITQTAATGNGLNTAQSARLFALMNITFADSVIAFYDAKYTYIFWRPVTAIRAADTDNNPDTVADVNWLPEVGNTPSDPSYPGAHAVIATAGATILNSFLGTDQFNFSVTSEVMAGVQRFFPTFSAAAQESTLSRIFSGAHFRTDLTAGQQLGTEVADYVLSSVLTPVVP